MDMRTKEAVRYLGYGNCAVDDKTLQMIEASFKGLESIAEKKSIYRIFEVKGIGENTFSIGKMVIQSKNLQTNLKDCKEVVLFGATLGSEVDRQIRKLELIDMSKAVVWQACAATYLEEYCDEIQVQIEKKMNAEGKYIRPRFSPGYGDFSILHQKDLLTMLETPKQIGLAMTDGYMLTPTKSVTAVMGISKTKERCHKKGCEACDREDCTYRRS